MEALKKLEQKPFFTTSEARKGGISSRMLSYYTEVGKIERIARGVYCSARHEAKDKDLRWEDLAVAASNIKGGVICLTSALIYYDLTDDMMREFWIAVHADNSKAKFPKCRMVRMSNMDLGVKRIKMADLYVKIFDVERTVIDSFKFLDFEMAMKALKKYLNGEIGKPNLPKLESYIKKLRSGKIRQYVMAVVA